MVTFPRSESNRFFASPVHLIWRVSNERLEFQSAKGRISRPLISRIPTKSVVITPFGHIGCRSLDALALASNGSRPRVSLITNLSNKTTSMSTDFLTRSWFFSASFQIFHSNEFYSLPQSTSSRVLRFSWVLSATRPAVGSPQLRWLALHRLDHRSPRPKPRFVPWALQILLREMTVIPARTCFTDSLFLQRKHFPTRVTNMIENCDAVKTMRRISDLNQAQNVCLDPFYAVDGWGAKVSDLNGLVHPIDS